MHKCSVAAKLNFGRARIKILVTGNTGVTQRTQGDLQFCSDEGLVLTE
jgi:hypothetical protein